MKLSNKKQLLFESDAELKRIRKLAGILKESPEQQVNLRIRELYKILEKAKIIAAEIGSYQETDEFTGTEALDLTQHLEQIYAAFMTGDPKDDSENSTIFK